MDENVYLFDYNVRLVFYSIEISRRIYITVPPMKPNRVRKCLLKSHTHTYVCATQVVDTYVCVCDSSRTHIRMCVRLKSHTHTYVCLTQVVHTYVCVCDSSRTHIRMSVRLKKTFTYLG